MKIKTVFLAGLVAAAGVLTASAATNDVFSVNAVGFVNITVTNGTFRIITNPLNQLDNTLPSILPNAPVNTRVYKFNYASQSFSVFTMRAGAPNFWSGTGATTNVFNPGEGFFVQNATGSDFTLTFVGEVAQGTALPINIPIGFSMLAPHVPQSGRLTSDLGLNASNNDRVYFYRGGYVIATYRASLSAWTGAIDPTSHEPMPDVGEGFFYQATVPQTWTRNFTANN